MLGRRGLHTDVTSPFLNHLTAVQCNSVILCHQPPPHTLPPPKVSSSLRLPFLLYLLVCVHACVSVCVCVCVPVSNHMCAPTVCVWEETQNIVRERGGGEEGGVD